MLDGLTQDQYLTQLAAVFEEFSSQTESLGSKNLESNEENQSEEEWEYYIIIILYK